MPSAVAQSYTLSTQEAQVGELLQVKGHLWLHNEALSKKQTTHTHTPTHTHTYTHGHKLSHNIYIHIYIYTHTQVHTYSHRHKVWKGDSKKKIYAEEAAECKLDCKK